MKRWLITISFNQKPNDEMLSLIPAEQAHVRELMSQGLLETIYIASDNSKVWLVMHGETTQEIDQALTLFPMYRYFEPTITGIN